MQVIIKVFKRKIEGAPWNHILLVLLGLVERVMQISLIRPKWRFVPCFNLVLNCQIVTVGGVVERAGGEEGYAFSPWVFLMRGFFLISEGGGANAT